MENFFCVALKTSIVLIVNAECSWMMWIQYPASKIVATQEQRVSRVLCINVGRDQEKNACHLFTFLSVLISPQFILLYQLLTNAFVLRGTDQKKSEKFILSLVCMNLSNLCQFCPSFIYSLKSKYLQSKITFWKKNRFVWLLSLSDGEKEKCKKKIYDKINYTFRHNNSLSMDNLKTYG